MPGYGHGHGPWRGPQKPGGGGGAPVGDFLTDEYTGEVLTDEYTGEPLENA